MVSTVAGTMCRAMSGKDIVMIPSIVDVAGINRISREIFAGRQEPSAAWSRLACPGSRSPVGGRFHVRQYDQCVEAAKVRLEQLATRSLFSTPRAPAANHGKPDRVGADRRCARRNNDRMGRPARGGVLAPARAARSGARHGVPAIVTPGCLDMVNFWAPETVRRSFSGRRFYQHNPNITLMRTTPDECHQLGEILAGKLNGSTGRHVLLPLKGSA